MGEKRRHLSLHTVKSILSDPMKRVLNKANSGKTEPEDKEKEKTEKNQGKDMKGEI